MPKPRPNPRSLDAFLMKYTTNLLTTQPLDRALILEELPFLFESAIKLRDTLHLAMPKNIVPHLESRYQTIAANINTLAQSVNYPDRL